MSKNKELKDAKAREGKPQGCLSGWISVSDQLPDVDKTVLVACSGCGEPVWLGWYDDSAADGGQWFSVNGSTLDDVTHWRELPEPPAMETEGGPRYE